MEGSVEKTHQALESGADINYQEKTTGDTPFHLILRYQGHNKELMFKIMSDPNFNDTIKNNRDLTALEELDEKAKSFLHK